jgi:ArsR family transcriptional regulator
MTTTPDMMTLEMAAGCLAQLGNPTRLAIFRLLVRAAPDGLPVGAVRDALDVPASTLSHHIQHLCLAGLVDQAREGRVLRCRADMARMDALIAYLSDECCLGVDLDLPETETAA